MKDYYKILEISYTATDSEIEKAFKKLRRMYHPDANIGKSPEEINKCEQKFKDIYEAYETLIDPIKRKDYDAKLKRAQQRSSKNWSNSKKNEHSNFADKMKKTYKEVKEEESQEPFFKRHRKINRQFEKNFGKFVDSTPKEVVFQMGKGIVHVFYEGFYQINKLKFISEDPIPKFIIRNRKLLATALCATIIFSGNIGNAKEEETTIVQEPIVAESSTNVEVETGEYNVEEEEEYSSIITLTRDYKVQSGDALSVLAENAGVSKERIKSLNNYNSDLLYIGDELLIPYEISSSDLQYYTMTIPTNGKSLADLASDYQTTEETLYKLNKEAIETVGNAYVVVSDQILVPNFITRRELKELKEQPANSYQR